MPNAIAPIERNVGTPMTDPAPAGGSVRRAGFGYGVSPRDEVVTSTPSKPITHLPRVEPHTDPGQRNPTWDKVANVGRKTAWGAAATVTAGTAIFAAGAAAGSTAAALIGASIFATVLIPTAAVGALGLAAWGLGKLANRGKPPPPEMPKEPEKPKGTWAKIKTFGRKVAKAGAVLTAASVVAGLAAPLAATPLLFGAAAFVCAPIAAAGGLMWALGELKD